MTKVGLPPMLASACVVLSGPHGAISRQALQRGVCRQRLYRETAFVLAAVSGNLAHPQLESLRQEVAALRQQVHHLHQQLAQAIVASRDQHAQFAATAQAEGVSLPVARRLLAVLLGAATPSVAQLGRYSQQAAQRASALLAVLDPPSRALVRQVSADEMFVGRRPVLMLVEPDSLCWVSGRLAAHRDGAHWAAAFAQLPHLEHVLRDGGTGLEKGLEQVDRQRQTLGQAPVAQSLDHFHVLREGTRALRRLQGQSSRALEEAERADKAVARQARHGGKVTGLVTKAGKLWRRAEAIMNRWCEQERAWQRLRAGLGLFTAAGRLNTRAQAAAVVAEMLPQLQDAAWAKTRRYLQQPQLLTYLDRVAQRLAAWPEPAQQAAVRAAELERQAQQRRSGANATLVAGLLLVVGLLRSLAERLAPGVVAAVAAILGQAWRGSSAVEGMNSVLRMQQNRHRRLTQGLLDLKRLYWNCRRRGTGKRRGQTPYQRLGLNLTVDDWWQLLKIPPEQLQAELSAPKTAA